ncbi:hypothetical protein FRAHR75_770020 [Frankia sp. Hr75.2]|nr:hypothetical protein FRAHR75_770020 [Frankia sp. Hr75.2]
MARHCRGRCGRELAWYSFRLHYCQGCARSITTAPRESKTDNRLVSVERFLGPIALSTEHAPWADGAIRSGALTPGWQLTPAGEDTGDDPLGTLP